MLDILGKRCVVRIELFEVGGGSGVEIAVGEMIPQGLRADDARKDGKAGEYGRCEGLKSYGGESGRVPGEPLFLAALAGEGGAPNFFLTLLLGDEFLEGSKIDEPQAVDALAVNQLGAGEA